MNYAIVVSTCAGMWAHLIGDTVRFESLAPPLLDVHRPHALQPLGLRRAPDQRRGRGGDRAGTRRDRRGPARLAHRAGVLIEPDGTSPARRRVRRRARRSGRSSATRSTATSVAATPTTARIAPEGAGLPCPGVVVAARGGFEDWMRSRGKLGGQNKVPRMDGTGALTGDLVEFLRTNTKVRFEVSPSTPRRIRRGRPARGKGDYSERRLRLSRAKPAPLGYLSRRALREPGRRAVRRPHACCRPAQRSGRSSRGARPLPRMLRL